MRSAPKARQDILRSRRAVKVGARPLIAIVMPHEFQEARVIAIGKVIALGGFDSRRPIAAAIARRSIRARTTGFGAMRRYLNITRPSQLRSAAIAERRVEAYSRWQEAIVSFGGRSEHAA